jgi:hypothetical protein
MRPRIVLLLAAPSVLLAAACAHRTVDEQAFTYSEPAAEAPPPAQVVEPVKITRYADADRDGRVTRKEAKADPALEAVFDNYDVDGSGDLDRGEFARLEDESRERRTAAAPAHAPPEVTIVEMPLARQAWPAASSLNRTGVDEIRPGSGP